MNRQDYAILNSLGGNLPPLLGRGPTWLRWPSAPRRIQMQLERDFGGPRPLIGGGPNENRARQEVTTVPVHVSTLLRVCLCSQAHHRQHPVFHPPRTPTLISVTVLLQPSAISRPFPPRAPAANRTRYDLFTTLAPRLSRPSPASKRLRAWRSISCRPHKSAGEAAGVFQALRCP